MRNARAFALALTLLFASAPAAAGDEPIDWLTDIPAALEAAEARGAPVFVDAWAIWCVPCKLMDETTYVDPRVTTAMETFVPLKVDHDAQRLFVDRYRIEALPTVLVLDERGDELTRIVGLVETEPLLALLESIREGYAGYRENMAAEEPSAALAAGEFLLRLDNPEGALDRLEPAVKRAEGTTKDRLALRIGEAELAAGRTRAAAKTLGRLARRLPEGSPERGQALAGLVRAHRERGKDVREALAELQANHPDLARDLD